MLASPVMPAGWSARRLAGLVAGGTTGPPPALPAQVIADGQHGVPDWFHGIGEDLANLVSFGFGIEHGTGKVDRDVAVASLRDAAPGRGVRDGLRAEPVVVHAAPGVQGNMGRVAGQAGDRCRYAAQGHVGGPRPQLRPRSCSTR